MPGSQIDAGSQAEWKIWYQDTFDRECPRQIEATGRGLIAGLIGLWARHLFETVGANGQQGFARFDLWWKQRGQSITIVGKWEGMVQLRKWVFGDKERTRRGYIAAGNKRLLTRIAETHRSLILAGQTSEKLLALAADCPNRQDFEKRLSSVIQDV